jgi:DNA-binding NtrC family response regulator
MEPSSTSTSRPVPPCSVLPIAVVDDDRTFRVGLAANLRDDGHVVQEYVAPLAVDDGAVLVGVRVVVSDYQMERENGLTFADAVHVVDATIAVVLVTAYTTRELEAEVDVRPFLRLCHKPIDYDRLHQLIHELARSIA